VRFCRTGRGIDLAPTGVPRSLRYLTPEDDQLLGDVGTRLVYSAGDVLVRAGTPLGTLLVLRRGIVRIQTGDDPEIGPICRLPAVDLIGEGVLLGALTASLTAVAESEIQADVLDGRVLEEIIATRPGFAARLFRAMAHALHVRLTHLTGVAQATS